MNRFIVVCITEDTINKIIPIIVKYQGLSAIRVKQTKIKYYFR